MLLMGSNQEEQIPLVHWENFSIVDVMLLLVRFFTNALVLHVINGPTEGLMLIYLIHFLTAIVGASGGDNTLENLFIFLSWIPFINEIIMCKAVLFLMIMFAVMPTSSSNVHNVHQVVLARKGNMLLALAMLYPFVMLLVGTLMWDYISPIDLMGNYPHLLVVGTGLAFGFLVSLFYLPFAIANALTARLNDGGVVILIGR